MIGALLAALLAANTPVLPLAGPVSELAADGGRVAILVRTKTGSCARDRVAVWASATRRFVPIGASACVGSTSTGAGLFSVGSPGRASRTSSSRAGTCASSSSGSRR